MEPSANTKPDSGQTLPSGRASGKRTTTTRKFQGSRAHSRGKADRGRLWLFLIFLVLFGTYLAGAHFTKNVNVKEYRLATAVCYVMPLWLAALLIGVWFRQVWAHVLLAIILVVSILISAAVAPILYIKVPPAPNKVLIGIALYGLVNLISLVILLASKDIKRLISRAYN